MPISDEVIELAPVKKTKKTLIIMIAAMGAMFALAVAFLVMYLIKPSVTEDKNHVKDITLVSTELFSEAAADGKVKYYASIGNEYTVYSTLTVDNNSSTNVQWDCDPDLLEITGQSNTGEPFLKFIPRVGTHGKTAKITVRAPSQVSEYKTIEFTIVNQGAEDIQVTQYGVRGNLTDVKDDNIEKDLSITVPYYTMSGSKNNQPIQVKFQQLSKSKITSVETAKNGPKTDDVTVTSSDESVISINQDTVSNEGFSFDAKKFSDKPVIITITANAYNVNCGELTKTISVKVDSNGALGFVDSIYVFNKPIVDEEFISKVLLNGNNSAIDSTKLKTEIGKDKSIKYAAYNDSQVLSSSDFELVLPYSNNNSITYNDIFKHILLNPVDIQYKNGEVTTDWYKNIDVSVKSSDSSILQVNTNSTTGEVKLYPRNVASKVDLTFKDKKKNSAGASITVPVRIIAQTDSVELACNSNKATATNPNIEVVAAVDGDYKVNVTYTFIAPERNNPKTLWEENCLNNAYTLVFDKNEMVVKQEGESKALEPNTVQYASGDTLAKVSGTSGASTKYTAAITFDVKVIMDSTGAAVFKFVKNGSDLYGTDDNNSLKSKDKAVELSASFQITESASRAWFLKDEEGEDVKYRAALDMVTENNTKAGNFVRESDTVVKIYVQNQTQGTVLNIVSLDNIKKLVEADKAYFDIKNITGSSGNGVTWNRISETLSFTGTIITSGSYATAINFEVYNVRGDKISPVPFQIQIYIIDAVADIRPVESKQTVQYDGTTNASVTINSSDVQVTRRYDDSEKNFTYNDVNLYYGNDIQFDKETTTDGYIFKHENKELFKFDKDHKLSTLTDIYAYSYDKKINFGNVELEFLLDDDIDEYLGKHYGQDFVYNRKMKLEFERIADGASLFSDSSYQTEVPLDDNGFAVSVNQDIDAYLYATSFVNVTLSTGNKTVYVERDRLGHTAPVQKATFTVPSGITPATKDESTTAGRYYSITYRSPIITKESDTFGPSTVYYANHTNYLRFTVNNVTRKISSIGIYSDEDCTSGNSLSGKSLLFGGFINQANRYTNTVYVRVAYENHQTYFTSFEGAELSLPSYLIVQGKTVTVDANGNNTYTLVPGSYSSENNYVEIYTCEIVLDKDEQVTDRRTVKVVPSDHKTNGQSVEFNADVQAGLKTLTVKNGEETVASITAGETCTYQTTFELKNLSDIKSLSLSFEYGAINGEGYDLAYDHTGNGLKVTEPAAVNGFAFTNNFKNAQSAFAIAIANDITKVATGTQTFTLTFKDEYNGANANNVFTLNIEITVTMDIYALAFADDTNATVTVTGESSGEQTLNISVVYNDGNAIAQPTVTTNKVLDVYVLDGSEYKLFTNGITVEQDSTDSTGKKYIVRINNNIARNQTYYLRLVYGNVTPDAAKHIRAITINTLTSHIEFDGANTIKLTYVEGESCPSASIIVTSASNEFTLVANVVNDRSGEKESGKQATYGLFTNFNCTNPATGITVNNGVIKVTDPAAINGTVYYLAQYTEQKTGIPYFLKVKLAYTVAPSDVVINGVDTNAFNAANKTLTLYYGNASNYTQADLSGKIIASTAFSRASYTAADGVALSVKLQNTAHSAYLDISGYVLKPKALNGNAVTTVPVVVTATYAGEKVEQVYNVLITPVAGLTLVSDSGTLNLLNRNSALTVTPIIGAYNGFTPTYTLTAADGLFDITGSGSEKTVKLANNTTAKKGAYTLTAALRYTYPAGTGGGITFVGPFSSSKTYTVNVEGDYNLTFDLMSGTTAISTYVSETTKHTVVDKNATYRISITSDDDDFDVTYGTKPVSPTVVSVAAFSGKTAAVTLIENASGEFAITVTATVGGQTYECTQKYYFMNGANVSAKLYMSANNGAYAEFDKTTQNIDYTDTPYLFKYEITGLPQEAIVNLVVNGNVTTGDLTTDKATGKRYCIITATKPTTMRIGASVNIGSRTVYLGDKTVELTATAPNFTLTANDTVLPAETATFAVNAATGFQGANSVRYAVISGGAYATIDATSGVLTAEKNVVTDQTVIVRATVTVGNGAYAGTYTIDKSITVTGVALPTIQWKADANKELYLNGKDNHTYSATNYAFDNNNGTTYNYTGKVTFTFEAQNGTLTKGADFSFDATNGTLTLKATDKTRAGGSLQLIVKATINSGAHQGASVSDTITVRVLPTMNSTASNITLGNAKATYDLNGDAYKSTFAPNTQSGEGFVKPTDSYSIVSLAVDNTTDFGVDGSKLIVKNNLTTATTVQVTATVLITSGAYVGTTVVGTKSASIAVPPTRAENVQWDSDDYKYNDITLTMTKVLGSAITGTISGITVVVPAAVSEYVTVADNGTDGPVVSVNKNYGAYFTATAPGKAFTVNYIVTLADGRVYYSSSNYEVAEQQVSITAKVGEETIGDSGYTVNANETFIVQLTADKGFDVVITNVSNSTFFNSTHGGNGVQFNIGSVTSDQTVQVELTLNVAGQTTTCSFDLTVLAPQTNAQYTANNTDNISFAVNNGELQNQSNAVVSTWSAANRAQYKYGQKLTITAPSGHRLNEYFDSLALVFNGQHSANNLNVNSATIDFPVITESGIFGSSSRRIESGTFDLNMTFKTTAAIPLSTIEVKFTVYNKDKGGSYTDVTVLYRVQVIGAVAVTLNTNAGDDNVPVSYNNPLYKHSYNLPTPTRTGYTLVGWYTAEKGGNKVENNATVINTQPHTLYAHWTAKEYTIEYNNEGSTSTRTEKAKYGATYGLLLFPEREGYNFVCWKDGSGNVITADTLVKPESADVETITLTAHWSIRYYTVTLNAGYGTLDGTNTTMTAQVPYGGSFTLHTLITPTRDGYRFVEWVASGSTSNVTDDIILTAIWKKQYVVSFDLNNTESTETFEGRQYDADAVYGTLPTPENTATKNFMGWSLTQNGSVIDGTNETVDGADATIILYAQWTTLATYTVTFETHSDVTAPQAITVVNTRTYGELPTLTRARYTFNGWYTEETGGNEVTSATVVNLSADQTLHAHWTQVVFTVTLDAGDGKVIGDNSTYDTNVATGQSYDLHLMITPTLDGYVFDGWWINGEGEEDDEKQESAITVTGDITLTAHWKKLYTVVFVPNFGGLEVAEPPAMPDPITVAEGETITLQHFDDIVELDLDFMGYSLSPLAGSYGFLEYTVNGDDAEEYATITLYVNWHNGE